MKTSVLLMAMITALPLSMTAQDDDMYFVPTKKNLTKERTEQMRQYNSQYEREQPAYYSGSTRDVDEYNRMGGQYQTYANDSDVVNFSGDSSTDFALTQRMSRYDGYTPSEAYWEGYDRGRSDEWAVSIWHSPWYVSSYYPWYDSYWYDPWYYDRPHWSWHVGVYYDPWYYRRGWGWSIGWGYHYRPYWYHSPYYHHRPYYAHGGGYRYSKGQTHVYRPSTGTQSHGRVVYSGRRTQNASGRTGIGASRGSNTGIRSAGRSYGGSSNGSSNSIGVSRSSSSSGGSYNSGSSTRSSSGSWGSSRSSSGSFGSSTRSSGSSIGAGRSSGGGSMGSGRSSGGSRSAGRR